MKQRKKTPRINGERNIRSSKFSYTVIVVTITMKFIAVVTPPGTYHGYSTRKTLWQEKFTPVNTTSCGSQNYTKHR